MTETEVRDEMHIDLADALRVPASSFTWKEMLAMASSDEKYAQTQIGNGPIYITVICHPCAKAILDCVRKADL